MLIYTNWPVSSVRIGSAVTENSTPGSEIARSSHSFYLTRSLKVNNSGWYQCSGMSSSFQAPTVFLLKHLCSIGTERSDLSAGEKQGGAIEGVCLANGEESRMGLTGKLDASGALGIMGKMIWNKSTLGLSGGH